MRLQELLKDLRPESRLGDVINVDAEVVDVELDSRRVEPGGVFVSTAAPSVGADHVAQARARGALATVGQHGSGADVIVLDGRVAAAQLGCAFHRHPSREINVVAITGTNGKSSVTTHWVGSSAHSASASAPSERSTSRSRASRWGWTDGPRRHLNRSISRRCCGSSSEPAPPMS